MLTISCPGLGPAVVTIFQGWGTLIICITFWSRDVLDWGMLFSEVDWVKICQGRGIRWWKLATLIICVRFRSRDVSDLEMLFSEVNWMIVKMLSSATLSISSDVKICQGCYIRWWKWDTLIIYVRFQTLHWSDLEGLVSGFYLVIFKSP